MTHQHVEQYTTRILADYPVCFACKRSLTVVAKYFAWHMTKPSNVYATRCLEIYET